MRLFELILQNTPPQRIARNVVEVVTNSQDGDISTVIKHFLHSVMDAIGFNYYVTTREITSNRFSWPAEQAKRFRFVYQRLIFERFRIFLEETCKIMNQENLLEPLIDFVEVFLKFVDSMGAAWEDNFREPFSMIAFSLLQSMHRIRKAVPETLLPLDNLCHKLFECSQRGLEYSDSYETVFKGLCVLLEKDYDYFSHFDGNIFKFYVDCMEYENTSLRAQLFIHMRNAIDNSRITGDSRGDLVTFLTEPRMIKIYCVFAEHCSRNLVSSLLKFLNSLLSHLPVFECITREQLHIFFSNALHKSLIIRSLAVEFYMTFMRKCFTDKLVLRDILDFYATKADNVDNLNEFIASLWDYFPYMTNFEPYLRILRKPDWSLKILCVTAQFTCRVFDTLYRECESNNKYASRLSTFLLKLPAILTLLGDKWQIRGILLHTYSLIDPEMALVTIKDFPIAADRFVKYSLDYLTKHDEDYSVVQNTVHNMLKFMDFFNLQEEMEKFAKDVYTKYKRLMNSPSEPTEDKVKHLQHILVLLSAITDTASALNEENIFELVSDLGTRLFDSTAFQELSVKHNCFLDSFAITTYSGCLNILSLICAQINSEDSNIESRVLLNKVQPFLQYLIKCLGDDDQSKVTIVFAEAAMRALCDLYIVFNFKLERHVYHMMVNSVNTHVFNTSSSTDRLRHLELQRNILHCFNLLHKFVEIPAPITWKVVIHFGQTPNFQQELTELMDILFEYSSDKFQNPKLFTYVIPVAIYNLFQRQVGIQKFHRALNAHKKYVENKLPNRSQRVMKLHIVLTIIDMMEKAMQAGDISQKPNRIELLSNMNILLTDVYQSESNLIISESRRLEQQSLTRNELETLTTFQERLSE